MREIQKAGSPTAAARPARTVINRRRVRDTWRDRKSGGERKLGPIWLCEARTRDQPMDIYNAWFDLKPGVSDVEFADRLKTYVKSLKNDGRMQGWGLMRRKLGLSAAPVGEFHLMMEFSDLAQLDSAFNRVGSRREPIEGVHFGVNSQVQNVQFALYRDFPDSIRHRGDEKF